MASQAFRPPLSEVSEAIVLPLPHCAGCVISGEGSSWKWFPACGHLLRGIPWPVLGCRSYACPEARGSHSCLFLQLIPPGPHPPRDSGSPGMWVLGNLGVPMMAKAETSKWQSQKGVSGETQNLFFRVIKAAQALCIKIGEKIPPQS